MDVLGDWGKSIPARPPKTEEEFAQCLEQVFSAVNVKRASIAGLSYGGFLSMNLAIKRPELVERLILLAPAATILPLSQKFWRTTMLSLIFPTKRVIERNISAFAYNKTFQSKYLDEIRFYGFRYGTISTMKVKPRVFTEQELGALSIPVLFLVGEQELIYDPFLALKKVTELIPGCKGEILPECGHSIYTDQPELLAKKIKEFLFTSTI